MLIANKRFYYFDKEERKKFDLFLLKNDMNKTIFCAKVGISLATLSLIYNGKRPINVKLAKVFSQNGYKVVIE